LSLQILLRFDSQNNATAQDRVVYFICGSHFIHFNTRLFL